MKSIYGKSRALDDEQTRVVMDWRASRRTLAQFAREFGVSITTIRKAATGSGVYNARACARVCRKLSASEVERIRAWWSKRQSQASCETESVADIARKLGVSCSTVRDAARGIRAYRANAPAGSARKISDADVERIQKWWSARRAPLARRVRTMAAIARDLGVSRETIREAALARGAYSRPEATPYRKLSNAQIERLQRWWRTRRTRAQLARELGVSQAVLSYAIAVRCAYKAPPAAQRAQAVDRWRRRMNSLRRQGFC